MLYRHLVMLTPRAQKASDLSSCARAMTRELEPRAPSPSIHPRDRSIGPLHNVHLSSYRAVWYICFSVRGEGPGVGDAPESESELRASHVRRPSPPEEFCGGIVRRICSRPPAATTPPPPVRVSTSCTRPEFVHPQRRLWSSQERRMYNQTWANCARG